MSVLLLSGGLDSLVLLARECAARRLPHCVSFTYGQRHFREVATAVEIARYYGVRHSVLNLDSHLFAGSSALTGTVAVPKGLHYEDPKQKATVVPNRNMVFLSCAAALAARENRKSVLFAAHAGDAAIYPDCRAGFVRALDEALWLSCGVHLEAPFVNRTKRDIVALGRELRAPLASAWSCYEGGEKPCGQCGACVERKEAGA